MYRKVSPSPRTLGLDREKDVVLAPTSQTGTERTGYHYVTTLADSHRRVGFRGGAETKRVSPESGSRDTIALTTRVE